MSTIKDVARLAGVSPSTVSRVLSSDGNYASAETREKIWEAVRECNFTINETARRLRKPDDRGTAPLSKIDCIFARNVDSFVDPFFIALKREIEIELFRHNFLIRRQLNAPELVSQHSKNARNKDSAIVLGRVDAESLREIRSFYKNVVYVGLQDLDMGIDSVVCKGYDATTLAMEHLYSLGHRKICYLGETKDEQRYQAYHDFMNEHAADGCEIQTIDVPFAPEDAFETMNRVFEASIGFSAIFCANDISAEGVLNAAKMHHIAVPDKVSIIGINDVEAVRYLKPMLTVVNIPIKEMGSHAARLLISRIERHHTLPVKLMVPSSLSIRNSCAKPALPF